MIRSQRYENAERSVTSPRIRTRGHVADLLRCSSRRCTGSLVLGDPIVFMHGNPTSSFLWRNILPKFEGKGRLLAPDMIGFGQSGKPAIEYSLADFQRYYDAWFELLDLRNATLVLQDYGGLFGVDWARRHADRVKAIALLEPVLRPLSSKALEQTSSRFETLFFSPVKARSSSSRRTSSSTCAADGSSNSFRKKKGSST